MYNCLTLGMRNGALDNNFILFIEWESWSSLLFGVTLHSTTTWNSLMLIHCTAWYQQVSLCADIRELMRLHQTVVSRQSDILQTHKEMCLDCLNFFKCYSGNSIRGFSFEFNSLIVINPASWPYQEVLELIYRNPQRRQILSPIYRGFRLSREITLGWFRFVKGYLNYSN